jgi:hypothetical protein
MKLGKIKHKICALWLRLSMSWMEAHEMQKRIDEARAEHIRQFGFHWKI